MSGQNFEGVKQENQEFSKLTLEELQAELTEVEADILSFAGKIGALLSEKQPEFKKYSDVVEKLELKKIQLVTAIEKLTN